ncbi:uncharacterized protein BDR25DRAFT_386959, partial [Lindgomyces ingoldianus]
AGSASLTSTTRDVHLCASNVVYDSRKGITHRIIFDTSTTKIYGYPSRGGVIMLECSPPPDFNFLVLGRVYPLVNKIHFVRGCYCWVRGSGIRWHGTGYRTVKIVQLDDSDEPEPTKRERH